MFEIMAFCAAVQNDDVVDAGIDAEHGFFGNLGISFHKGCLVKLGFSLGIGGMTVLWGVASVGVIVYAIFAPTIDTGFV